MKTDEEKVNYVVVKSLQQLANEFDMSDLNLLEQLECITRITSALHGYHPFGGINKIIKEQQS